MVQLLIIRKLSFGKALTTCLFSFQLSKISVYLSDNLRVDE
jgi:hypothetical protein